MPIHCTRQSIDDLSRLALLTVAIFPLLLLVSNARAEDPVSKVVFACKDDMTIDATFYSERVDLTLSDGRSLNLPQTMSGSGIRYATPDEAFVFWSKGDTAFVTEGAAGAETCSDCVTK